MLDLGHTLLTRGLYQFNAITGTQLWTRSLESTGPKKTKLSSAQPGKAGWRQAIIWLSKTSNLALKAHYWRALAKKRFWNMTWMDKTISSKKTEEHPSQIISTTTSILPDSRQQHNSETQLKTFFFLPCALELSRHSSTWTKLLFQQACGRRRLGCLHNPCPALKIPSHAQGWVSRPQEDMRGPPPLNRK